MKTPNEEQYYACRNLFASVVMLAVKDACTPTSTKKEFEEEQEVDFGEGKIAPAHATSALNFLFYHSDGYLGLLDIDPGQFRKRLEKFAEPPKPEVKKSKPLPKLPFELTDFEIRNFRINYHRWMRDR